MPDLSTVIGGLRMRNPVMLASGTAGYGPEYDCLVDFASVGAVVMKTVTLEPRAGNRPPRLVETPCGLLNAIGLENVGLERFLDEKLPEAAALPTELVASLAGVRVADYAELAGALGARSEIAALELNISCPNVERARNPVWNDPDAVTEIVTAAREATESTIIVKLSPNTADIVGVAEAAAAAGADALTVANTLPGMRIDLREMKPALGNVTGGLSGRALMPVNLAMVWKVAAAVDLPVVGSGGIATAEDALEFIAAGATAVQVGTALFSEPSTAALVAEGLADCLEARGINSLEDAVGAAREERQACKETALAD